MNQRKHLRKIDKEIYSGLLNVLCDTIRKYACSDLMTFLESRTTGGMKPFVIIHIFRKIVTPPQLNLPQMLTAKKPSEPITQYLAFYPLFKFPCALAVLHISHAKPTLWLNCRLRLFR